jgi:succinyl-CoA synthetase beta subunit
VRITPSANKGVTVKLHEFQAKRILADFGIPIPRGEVASNPFEVYEIARRFGGTVVVKAQIHAGGRGKGGGVKLAKSPEEAEAVARNMIGMTLVTHQTGPEGRKVQRVLVEEGVRIKKEYYLGIVIDRTSQRPVFMASPQGGVDIEKVAAETPDLIFKEYIDPAVGFQPFQARKLALALGVGAEQLSSATKVMIGLFQAFEAIDASLVEINPFLLTEDGTLVALDAKMNLDDNALFRHKEMLELRDFNEEDPLEIQASRYGINYIRLDGTIGCMVNGAGLAMATMDIIKLAGGSPANFLDVGGGANANQVRNAFQILLADKNVKAVLINIFGGIMRCDVVAGGVVDAAKAVGLNIPVVVRLEGTNVEQGREILQNSGLEFTVAGGMKDAAEKAVALAARGEPIVHSR